MHNLRVGPIEEELLLDPRGEGGFDHRFTDVLQSVFDPSDLVMWVEGGREGCA